MLVLNEDQNMHIGKWILIHTKYILWWVGMKMPEEEESVTGNEPESHLHSR